MMVEWINRKHCTTVFHFVEGHHLLTKQYFTVLSFFMY